MDMRSIRVGAGVGGAHVLLEYVVTEEVRSPSRFRLSCNRRPAALHRTDEAVAITVRRLDREVRVVESSHAEPSAHARPRMAE